MRQWFIVSGEEFMTRTTELSIIMYLIIIASNDLFGIIKYIFWFIEHLNMKSVTVSSKHHTG